MAYRVKINGAIAVIQGKQWKSSDPTIQSLLNNWLEIEKLIAITPESPLFWLNSPATPDPDYLIATEAVKVFGGKVLDEPLKPEPTMVDGKRLNPSEIIY